MKNPIIYVYLYGLLKREARGSNTIDITQFRAILKHTVRITNKYHFQILKEMIDMGLLKKLNRDNFELRSIKINNESITDSLGQPLW